MHASALLSIIAAILLAGCRGSAPPEQSKAVPPELSFAAQVAAVRDGASDTIRVDHGLVRDNDLSALSDVHDRLRRINLSHTEITDAGMAQVGQCRHLEQLRLASPNVTNAGVEHVAKLSELRFLHLLGMPITDAGIDKLHVLSQLESLYLDGTKVTDEGLARLIHALPNVHLHIDDHHHPLDAHGVEHKH